MALVSHRDGVDPLLEQFKMVGMSEDFRGPSIMHRLYFEWNLHTSDK